MARTSDGPRYYKSKKAWYANLGGERILLARGPKKETEAEAKERYDAEVEARRVEVDGDRSIVWAILNAYLRDCRNKVENGDMAKNTYEIHEGRILPFNEKCGMMKVRDLRPQHVTDWLAMMRKPRWVESLKRQCSWGDATVKQAKDVLKRVFVWAVDEAGLISRSPFDRKGKGRAKKDKRRRRRPVKSRAAILDAEHELLMVQARRRTKKDFYNLLLFLNGTGARPAEIYLARAEEWDEHKQAFIIKAVPEEQGRFKLAYLGEDRVVQVPNSLVPLAKELMAKYPDGPIFRTGSGKAWKNNTLCARFRSIKKAANRYAKEKGLPPVREQVRAYSYRHAFVTRWVEQDRSMLKLCELLNTSEKMLREHYSHLFKQTEALREALNDFDLGRVEAPSTAPQG
jgi:integrase